MCNKDYIVFKGNRSGRRITMILGLLVRSRLLPSERKGYMYVEAIPELICKISKKGHRPHWKSVSDNPIYSNVAAVLNRKALVSRLLPLNDWLMDIANCTDIYGDSDIYVHDFDTAIHDPTMNRITKLTLNSDFEIVNPDGRTTADHYDKLNVFSRDSE